MEGSSGLIVAFVVALWAAYFVPLVLRRYDEAAKNSSLDEDGPNRRVVRARRVTVATDEGSVVQAAAPRPAAPTAESDGPIPTETSPRVDRTSPAVDAQHPRITREAARVAATRRRRVLLSLLGLAAVLGGLAVAAIVPVWTPAVGAGLIVAWLVLCRVMVRQERGLAGGGSGRLMAALRWCGRGLRAVPTSLLRLIRWAGGSVRQAPAGGGSAADEEMTVVVSTQVEEYDPNRRHVMETDAPLAADALDEQLQIAVPSVSATTGQPVWDPLPITVPTYVSKPRAGRTVRTIEFGQPGAWTSGHVEGEQTEHPDTGRDDGDLGTDRRAVGH